MPIATAEPTPTPTPVPVETYRGITIAPEHRCSSYNSNDYSYPQSVEDRIISSLGGIYGPYTGTWFESKTETDIEHIVARSEAHDSGLCSAGAETRSRFSQDLINLTLASPSVNRHQKVDKDAAEWLPALNECWFVTRVVSVRQSYNLTIDQAEVDAIDRVLDACGSTALIKTERPSEATPESTSTSEPKTYESCEEAEAAGETRVMGSKGNGKGFPSEMVPSARDGDGDGVGRVHTKAAHQE